MIFSTLPIGYAWSHHAQCESGLHTTVDSEYKSLMEINGDGRRNVSYRQVEEICQRKVNNKVNEILQRVVTRTYVVYGPWMYPMSIVEQCE